MQTGTAFCVSGNLLYINVLQSYIILYGEYE